MKYNQHYQYWLLLPIIFFAAIALLLAACGERPKTYTVGIVNLTSNLDRTVEVFKMSMAEFGYTEGENITYVYEGATNKTDALDSAAQRLVEADVDLILSITTFAAKAAQRATADTDIPGVFAPLTDPVGAGVVKSLKQPGGNMTGITFSIQEGRRLQWLVEIAPKIEEIYIPYNPEDRSAVLALGTASVTAAKLGVELITRKVHNLEEVTAAIEGIPEKADAVFILPDSLVGTRVIEFIQAANTRKLPTSGPNYRLIERGVLTAYAMWQDATAKQAARLADQVLHGIKPADLPVEMAEFYLAINLKTAEAIGLNIPDQILFQADTIIR